MLDSLHTILEAIKKDRIKTYHILTFDLGTARNNEAIQIAGSDCYILDYTGAGVSDFLKFNETSNDFINIIKSRDIQTPFYRILLTNASQSGKILTLAIGVEDMNFKVTDFAAPDLALSTTYLLSLRNTYTNDYGTLVAKSNFAQNTTVLIHQVTSGKNFMFDHYSIQGFATASSSATTLIITDQSDSVLYNMVSLGWGAGASGIAQSGNPFLILPSLTKIKLFSGSAVIYSYGFIKGREY